MFNLDSAIQYSYVTVSVAVLMTSPRLAEMVAVVLLVTLDVVIVKPTEVLPAGIVTVVGVLAAGWLLEI